MNHEQNRDADGPFFLGCAALLLVGAFFAPYLVPIELTPPIGFSLLLATAFLWMAAIGFAKGDLRTIVIGLGITAVSLFAAVIALAAWGAPLFWRFGWI